MTKAEYAVFDLVRAHRPLESKTGSPQGHKSEPVRASTIAETGYQPQLAVNRCQKVAESVRLVAGVGSRAKNWKGYRLRGASLAGRTRASPNRADAMSTYRKR